MDQGSTDPKRKRATLASVLSLAFVFPAATVAGFLAGRWVGGQLGAPQAGAIIGTVVGFLAGMLELVRVLDPKR